MSASSSRCSATTRPETADNLREHAASGLEANVLIAFADWKRRLRSSNGARPARVMRSTSSRSRPIGAEDEERDLKRLGASGAPYCAFSAPTGRSTPSALERLGLLPNYTLVDDAATLNASLWWKDDDGFHSEETRVRPERRGRDHRVRAGQRFLRRRAPATIDALDVGTASEPQYETWRLCPECGYGAVEKHGELVSLLPPLRPVGYRRRWIAPCAHSHTTRVLHLVRRGCQSL